jgi:hypothetical protein
VRDPEDVRRTLIVLTALLALLLPATAHAATRKAIAGPVELDGASAFPIYRDLGARIYQATLDWSQVAAFRPDRARDPQDPSYDWPQDLDEAVSDAKDQHIQIALTISGTPRWAKARKPADYADFAVAAAREYPSVHLWIVWQDAPRTFTPSHYAKLLDAAYGALKSVSKHNLVAGGASTASGTAKWIKGLKVGRRAPRLDLYAHDPSSPHRLTAAGLKSLDARVRARFGAKRLFLSGYTLPTLGAHHVGPATQAADLAAALKLADHDAFVYAFGYDGLTDQGHTDGRGLLEADGTKRPAYAAFKRG